MQNAPADKDRGSNGKKYANQKVKCIVKITQCGKMSTKNYLVPILLPRKEMIITKGEAGICAEIASYLKVESIYGRLPFVWFHVANEWAGQNRPVYGAKQTTMGKIAGIPDYCFLGQSSGFFIEVKTPHRASQLSKEQKAVKQWCDDMCVPHYVCRSLQEVERVLNIERTKQETIHQIVSNRISGFDHAIREDEVC